MKSFQTKIIALLITIIIAKVALAKCVVCVNIEGSWYCTVMSDYNCPGHQSGLSDLNHYCKQLMLVAQEPPIIHIQEDGNAFLDNNGQITRIASDRAEAFFAGISKLNKKEVAAFLKSDDGIVSPARLNAIAKELNAGIIRSPVPILPNYCPACEDEAINTPGRKTNNGAIVFFGGGITNPGSKVKEQTYSGSIAWAGINAYIPLKRWPQVPGKPRISLGINTGGSYDWGNKNDITTITPYRVQREIGAPAVAVKANGQPLNAGFRIEAGPSVMITIKDHFSINPIFNAAHLNLTRKAFTAAQTSVFDSLTRNWDLLKQEEAKTTGFAFIPKLRLLYTFGKLGIWAEGSYIIGPKTNTVSTWYKPEGNAHPDGTYDLRQMNTPIYTRKENSTNYKAWGFSGGIAVRLGNPKGNNNSNTGGVVNGVPPVAGLRIIHTWVECVAGSQVTTTQTSDGILHDVPNGKPCNGKWGYLDGVRIYFRAPSRDTVKSESEHESITIEAHWRAHKGVRHGLCRNGGFICFEDACPWPNFTNLKLTKFEPGQTFGNTTTELLNENTIKITTIGMLGSIPDEMMESFIQKKVKPEETVFTANSLKYLLANSKLGYPKNDVIFKPEEQRYEVVNTTNDGKPVQIIEVYQKTKITIDDKEYNLLVITTSGRGTGSPRLQNF